jgi:sugar transport family protein
VNSQKANKTLSYRWIILIILLIAYFFVYFHRTSTAVVGTEIVSAVGGSVALLGSAYFYSYMLMQIPSGLMADRYGVRSLVSVFLLIAALGAFLIGLGESWNTVLIGRVLIGLGLGAIYIPMLKVLAVWFKKNEFASLNGIILAVGNAGAIASATPLAILSDAIGWQDVFIFLAITTLILAVMCYVIIRNHPSEKGYMSIEEIISNETGVSISDSTSAKVSMKSGLMTVVTSGRKFWAPAIAYFLLYGTLMTYEGLWAGTYFNNAYDFEYNSSWMITAVGIGMIIGAPLAGLMSDRVFHSRKRVSLTGNIGYAVIWLIIFTFAGMINNYTFWIAVNVAMGFTASWMIVTYAQLKDWFPIAISGTAVATMNVFLFLGAGVMQSLSHYIVNKNSSIDEFRFLWMIMFICQVLTCIFVYISPENKKGEEAVVKIREL